MTPCSWLGGRQLSRSLGPRMITKVFSNAAAAPFDGLFDPITSSLPLHVAKVPGAGNGMLAKRDIRYGEELLTAKPMLTYPSAAKLHMVCYLCLKHLGPGPPPVQQSGHSFCSRQCADTALHSFLAVEASTDMSGLHQHCEHTSERFPLLAARLACQIISQAAEGSNSGGMSSAEAPDAWLSTLSYANLETTPEAWKESWFVMADALRRVEVPGLTTEALRGLLLNRVGIAWFTGVLGRLHTNIFKVAYPAPMADGFLSLRELGPEALAELLGGGGQAGSACYHLPSMFNHSCEPNVDVNFPAQDSAAVFTAARDIDASEQLFISYIDATQSRQERQRFLQWAYGFKCQCALCQDEE
eukprot:CAMPEP_0117654088 /NCGR_PEP_ID=MMETSP0804-20121206/3553_1 /TAXON_ID=1074897 /ORGANISM="Tetraselmis astigmatica, Strain CCMP880" /LENGTH=356 /DNA_ID=CAMNT_0005460337 /DNA_START=146 /DNA_END=1216 /DNA_ORIENTATION=-